MSSTNPLFEGIPPASGTEGPAIPSSNSAFTQERLDDEPEVVEAAPEETPTESHELANADHEQKGAAQVDHGQTEVRDLGWNDEAADVPVPLVGGLPNEELWTLVRRFNKVSLNNSSRRLKVANADSV
jgi:hypothetical protein